MLQCTHGARTHTEHDLLLALSFARALIFVDHIRRHKHTHEKLCSSQLMPMRTMCVKSARALIYIFMEIITCFSFCLYSLLYCYYVPVLACFFSPVLAYTNTDIHASVMFAMFNDSSKRSLMLALYRSPRMSLSYVNNKRLFDAQMNYRLERFFFSGLERCFFVSFGKV